MLSFLFSRSAIIACSALMLISAAKADPISYQGQLNDDGVPANGIYDIKFQLFDALIDGNQVGPTVDAMDVTVVNGVFRTQLDFGDAYSSADLWMRILVRPGDVMTAFTELQPRQPLTQVPKAAYASVAETALDSFWESAGPDTIMFGNGIKKVLINRSSPILSNEYFSVHADTSSYGGMMISTNTGGFPYYAYGVGNMLKSYTSYRESDDSWRLWISNNFILNVDGQGDVSAAGKVQADSYELNTIRTLVHSVSGDVFHSGSNSNFLAGDVAGGAYQSQSGGGWLMAPVNLPDGAVVTGLSVTFLDNAQFGDMTVALQRRTIGGTLDQMAAVTSAGQSASVQTIVSNTIVEPTIDNSANGYHLRAFSSNWPGNLLLRVFGARIEYTVEEVQ